MDLLTTCQAGDLTRIEREAAYHVRAALIRAADPMDFQRRFLAGLAVQRRVRIGKTAGRVIQLPQRRQSLAKDSR